MMSKLWDVWSLDLVNRRGMVVHEHLTEQLAKASADRKNMNAVRFGLDGFTYVALPRGSEPNWADYTIEDKPGDNT